MKKHILLQVALTGLVMAFFSGSASAGVVFSDNFEGYTNGVFLSSGAGNPAWRYVTNATNKNVQINQDTSNVFGAGTTNQYAALTKTDAAGGYFFDSQPFSSGMQMGKVSFDFYVPTSPVVGDNGIYLRLDNNASVLNDATGTAFSVYFLGGNLYEGVNSGAVRSGTNVAYNLGTKNSLDIVFNNTFLPVDYGTGTVAGGQMDIWINGSLVATWVGSGGLGQGNNISNLWFGAGPGSAMQLNVDNISVSSIPEPSAFWTLMATSLVAAVVFRVKGFRRMGCL